MTRNPANRRASRRSILVGGAPAATASLTGCLGGGTEQEPADPAPATTEPSPPAQTDDGADRSFGAIDVESINGRIEVTTDDDLVEKLSQAEAGDTIVLSAGVHEVDETLRRDVDNISLLGQGANSTTILRTGDFPLLELIGEGTWGDDRRWHWTLGNLMLSGGDGDIDRRSSNILHAEQTSGTRMWNVKFGGWRTDGNGLYGYGCWDWSFYRCRFAAAGNPEEGTADVYVENTDHPETANNFHFTDCHWERIQSYAFYSDASNNDAENKKLNRRFRFMGCKFHGQVGEDSYPDLPYIAGGISAMQIINTVFGPAHTDGYIKVEGRIPPLGRGGHLITNNVFSIFSRGDGAAIEVRDNKAAISNNYFYTRPTDNPAVRVTGGEAIVSNNHLRRGGLEAVGGTATFDGNTIIDAPRESITVETDGTVVTGNVIHGERGPDEAIHLADASECVVGQNRILGAGVATSGGADYNTVHGNVLQGGGVELAGSNSESGLNVTR